MLSGAVLISAVPALSHFQRFNLSPFRETLVINCGPFPDFPDFVHSDAALMMNGNASL